MQDASRVLSRIRSFVEQPTPVLIGYMRVSKADGSQTLDLQRDALLAAGVKPGRLYEDHASGKRDSRPGLEACLKALRKGDTLVAWKLDRPWPRPAPLGQSRPRTDRPRCRPEDPGRPRRAAGHHDRQRPSC